MSCIPRSKKAAAILIILILSTLLLASCQTANYGQDGQADPETIRIAVAAPFSGKAEPYGKQVYDGAWLKAQQINQRGGIEGLKVELVKADDRCLPDDAAAWSKRLADDPGIRAVIGHVCSSATLAALPSYVEKGIPVISPSSTRPGIGQQAKGWFFRVAYLDARQGDYLAEYAVRVLGLYEMAVMHDQNDYGNMLSRAFQKAAREKGIKITSVQSFSQGDTGFKPQLSGLIDSNPEGVYIAGFYKEGAYITRQLREMGYRGVVIGGDAMDHRDYVKLAGIAAEGTLLAVPFAPSDANREFREKFRAQFGREADWMSANAYDCMGILAQAMEAVGTEPQKIRDQLAGHDRPDWAYQGVSGQIYFDKYGDTLKYPSMKTIKNGDFITATQLGSR